MPIPLAIWLIGAGAAALGIAAASSSSSSRSSSGSSGSSRSTTETDHEAIKNQQHKDEQQRIKRMRKDIAHDVSSALNTLGWPHQLTVTGVKSLTDQVLIKPGQKDVGVELLHQLNELKLGSKKQRQLFAHLLAKMPEQQRGLPDFEQELAQLSRNARLCDQLEQLHDQVAKASECRL